MLKAGGAGVRAGGGAHDVIRCPGGCNMARVHGIPAGYDGHPRCDECGYENLHTLEFFFHCAEHDYDLCRVCASKSVGKLRVDENGKFLIRGHGCPMLYEPHGDRHWGAHGCDGALLLGPNGRCQSSITYNLSNKNQQYFWCDSCNVDICVCCAEKLQY